MSRSAAVFVFRKLCCNYFIAIEYNNYAEREQCFFIADCKNHTYIYNIVTIPLLKSCKNI